MHFEVVAKGGWLSNLVSGGQPFVEVTSHGADALEVNLSFDKPARAKLPDVPGTWKSSGKHGYVLPVGGVHELGVWIRSAFESVAERENQRIAGWLEG